MNDRCTPEQWVELQREADPWRDLYYGTLRPMLIRIRSRGTLQFLGAVEILDAVNGVSFVFDTREHAWARNLFLAWLREVYDADFFPWTTTLDRLMYTLTCPT